jgi:hypothetical protein
VARLHAFWVILAGTTPTAFRAKVRDVLLPTLHQLQRTQPDVSLQWFERGRLWPSPDEARHALAARRQARPVRRPDWRPGGTHADPHARFKLTRDQKRARFKKRVHRGPGPGHTPDARPARGPRPPDSRGGPRVGNPRPPSGSGRRRPERPRDPKGRK